MLYSSFQYGFQIGFQVVYEQTVTRPNPNGNLLKGYIPRSFELQKINQLNKLEALRAKKKVAQQDLRAEQLKIEELELKRLRRGLNDKELQAQLLEMFLKEQQILQAQMALENLIAELQDEEDAIIIILLTMPF